MIKNEYNVVGVMSGTSLDGIDLALVKLSFKKNWSFKIIKAETKEYEKKWHVILKNLINKYTYYLLLSSQSYSK